MPDGRIEVFGDMILTAVCGSGFQTYCDTFLRERERERERNISSMTMASETSCQARGQTFHCHCHPVAAAGI
jgi:hypothetical protein